MMIHLSMIIVSHGYAKVKKNLSFGLILLRMTALPEKIPIQIQI